MVNHNLISDLNPDGLVVFDESGRVEYINVAFSDLTGFSAEHLVGNDETEFNSAINTLFESGSSQDDISAIPDFPKSIILSQIKPVTRLLSCSARALDNASTVSPARVIIFHIFSNEPEAFNHQRSDYLSVAGHKLRTPLVSILGFSELLLKRDFNAERQRELITTIYRQSDIFKQMLDNFLTLERLETTEGRNFNFKEATLEQVVNEVISEFSAIDEVRKLEFNFESTSSWPLVNFDYEKIKQVLTNLVDNAVSYSPDNNTISLMTQLINNDGVTEFGLSVCDEGIGIANSNLKRIGERFYRVDELQSVLGGGLGLSIVKSILLIHNGRLEITSEKGEGTTATIWLPTVS